MRALRIIWKRTRTCLTGIDTTSPTSLFTFPGFKSPDIINFMNQVAATQEQKPTISTSTISRCCRRHQTPPTPSCFSGSTYKMLCQNLALPDSGRQSKGAEAQSSRLMARFTRVRQLLGLRLSLRCPQDRLYRLHCTWIF